MNCIRSSLGPPWYLCSVRNCVTRGLVEGDTWAVIKPFVGSWTSAGISTGFGGSSLSRSAFERLNHDQKLRFLLVLGFFPRSSSESEESESESEDECKWISFCKGKSTGKISSVLALPLMLLKAYYKCGLNTNLPWSCCWCSSYLRLLGCAALCRSQAV